MRKATIILVVAASLTILGAQVVNGRGMGGARGGGGSRGGYSGGGQGGGERSGGASRGGYSGGESRGGDSRGGDSGRGQGGGEHSGAEGAAAGHAAAENKEPQASGAEGAAAGAAAANRNAPKYSGAQGAAAGAAAANRNAPQYSGAQGAAAGYSAAGWAGGSATHVGLPTDAGYGMAATGVAGAGYAGFHQTEAASGGVYAARGAAVRSSYTGGAFNQGWYAAHPGAWNPAGWTAGRAWGVATWPAVGSWYGWGGATQPIYYDYGNNVTYQGDQVYYDNQPVAPADQYYQQTSTLAQSQPASDPQTGEWMPLGVFGLVRGAESDPHYVMQLAVNKSGAVAGNYFDTVSGTSVPVRGAVDKETQRLAWTVGDNKETVGETGLYNLTKDESPALIHIGKDKTQQWTLVRLQQPQQ
jgi:hypothetical protein